MGREGTGRGSSRGIGATPDPDSGGSASLGEDAGDFYILGVGAQTPSIIDLLEALKLPIAGLYHYDDSRTGEKVLGYSIVGSNAELFEKRDLSGLRFALSMGDNDIRMNLGAEIRRLGGRLPPLIHPSAMVSRHAFLGEGTVASANSTVAPNVTIGRDVHVGYGVVVSHDATVEDGCFVGPNSTVGAYTTLCRGVFVGLASAILPKKGLTVGAGALIGGGSVVTKSVPAGITVLGNPARPLQS